MDIKKVLAAAIVLCSTSTAPAQDSTLTLGETAYRAFCASCHGEEAKGGGVVGDLFEVKPPSLTDLAARAGGEFPFADVYHVITLGMEAPGHGPSEMPVWGDHFMADALEDRGVSQSEALYAAAGRVFSLALYLESIQE